MKKTFAILFALLAAGLPVMSQYKPVENGSEVQFRIKNLGFAVTGTLNGLQGNIQFDPARPTEISFDVSVDATSINTDNRLRDNHLRGESYFNVAQYPRLHFVSTAVLSASKKDNWVVTGRLTIKNKTREIRFPFTAMPGAAGKGYLFKGGFTINRKDFDIGGTSTISENLNVYLNILANE